MLVNNFYLINLFLCQLYQALAEYNVPAVIKWPNDILIETKK